MIKAWSMSRLDVFESCPYRAFLQFVEKIPGPELVAPEGKDEHPLARGTRLHSLAEQFIKDKIIFPEELCRFTEDFSTVRSCFVDTPDRCFVEEEWAITDTWNTTGWFAEDAWGRMKLDYAQLLDDTSMLVVDFKTGKKYPPKHIQQGQLYALVASIRQPQVENFNVEFWYLDSGDKLQQNYTRTQVLVFQDDFDRRARTMTTATEFPPKSSAWNCRFCPYGEGKDGNKYCDYRYSA